MRMMKIYIVLLIACMANGSALADRGTWTATHQFSAGLTLLSIDTVSPWKAWTIGLNEMTSTNQIYHSSDGGVSWIRQYSGMGIGVFLLDVDFANENDGWVAGGFVLGFPSEGMGGYTHDGGATWNPIVMPHAMAMFQDVFVLDTQHIYLTGMWTFSDIEGVKISQNGGLTWTDSVVNTQSGARYSYFINPQEGWVSCGTWPDDETPTPFIRDYDEQVPAPNASPTPPCTYKRFEHDAARIPAPCELNSMKKRSGSYMAEIFHTTDGGGTWTLQYSDDGRFYLNDLYFLNANEGWVTAEADFTSLLLHTTDGGAHWEEVYYLSSGQHGLSDVLFVTTQEGWAFGMGPGNYGQPDTAILHTTNGGQRWDRENAHFPSGIMYGAFADPHRGFTTGGNNLKVSRAIRYDDGFYMNTPTTTPASGTFTPSPIYTNTPTSVPSTPPATPTKTQTPTTPNPTATNTPSPFPSATPNSSPTQNPTSIPNASGIYIYTNKSIYYPGDEFICMVNTINNENTSVDVDEYIVLEVYGLYYFWPTWMMDIDKVNRIFNAGSNEHDIILQFIWPSGIPSIETTSFWAALTFKDTIELFGNYSSCSFTFVSD